MNINLLAKKGLFQCMSSFFAQPIHFSFAYLRAKPNKKFQVKFDNWKIVRGDIIKVRTGKDKGKISQVLKVDRKANKVVCKKVNMRTTRVNDKTKGQLVKKKAQMPIHVSNIGLYQKQVNKAVRIRFGFHPKTGQRLRISKATGNVIPKPAHPEITRQSRGKNRVRGQKDTTSEIAHKITYEGQDFEAIRTQFKKFIAQKQEKQKYLVFKQ